MKYKPYKYGMVIKPGYWVKNDKLGTVNDHDWCLKHWSTSSMEPPLLDKIKGVRVVSVIDDSKHAISIVTDGKWARNTWRIHEDTGFYFAISKGDTDDNSHG